MRSGDARRGWSQRIEHTQRRYTASAPWEQLVPVPIATREALQVVLLRAPVDLAAAAKLVADDPGLALHVLQLAAIHSDDVVTDCPPLHSCIVLAGLDEIADRLSTVGSFALDESSPLVALWLHSRLSSWLAARLANLLGNCDEDTAHTAALLHDVGKLPGLQQQAAPHSCDHALIGEAFATELNLPIAIRDCIVYVDCPEQALRSRQLVQVVALADSIACSFGFGTEHDRNVTAWTATIINEALPGMSNEMRHRIVNAMEQEFEAWVKSPLTFSCVLPANQKRGLVQ